MSKLMLIDAVHPEETRVALVSDGQVDDFDFETTGKEQLRGNIYLAKVTRVEPSLQAAFVEYGGNRHGFLAFSEIHPDYYQLPQEDREALLKEAAEAAAEDEGEFDIEDEDEDGADASAEDSDKSDDEESDESEAETDASSDDEAKAREEDDSAEASAESEEDEASEDEEEAVDAKAEASARPKRRSKRPPNLQKRYKIQEVIRRRQVMLVQVVKEERGNKGAALTTYLSLAGRYSVLMPNTPRGGGISRKINSSTDRKRLKKIMGELDVPGGMGLIVRTAGAKRTKVEIKRDCDYLLKLWDQIRENTLSSMAPQLIHEEGGLVHRAMRDLYDKDIEEVLIQGEAAYKEAKELSKLLMPSQTKKVKAWKEPSPLFVEEGIEDQLDSIFSPTVQMKSGGYLVINQTEALVAIDVNSGKSTRERNIEQTALRTNLEAAEEACRQMRLRDLAGLVVIDFIDMDEPKNNRAVEKKLKECLKADRARVQHGRLSQFGLMEISRQRRRAGVLQATSEPCRTCNGTGRIRSVGSAALQLLRAIEARAATGGLLSITVEAPTEVALYLLNNKREALTQIEAKAGFAVSIKSSDELLAGDFTIHAEKDPNFKPARRRNRRRREETRPEEATPETDELETAEEDAESEAKSEDGADEGENAEGGGRKRRRRGRRGGRRRRRSGSEETAETAVSEDGVPAERVTEAGDAETPEAPKRAPKPDATPEDGGAYLDGLSVTASEMVDADIAADTDDATTQGEEDAPKERKPRRRRRRKPKTDAAAPVEAVEAEAEPETADTSEPAEPETPAPETTTPVEPETAPEPEPISVEAAAPEPAPAPAPASEPVPKAKGSKPKKRGWWSRRTG